MEQSHPNETPGKDPGPDKAKAILEAAFGVFAQYGYKRTSMEDIARAAGVSRPALYQHFRNKEDIMRSITASYFHKVNTALEEVLAAPGQTPPEALHAGFRVLADAIKLPLLTSPHGAEMIELTNTVAADIVAEGMRRKEAIFAAWLAQEAAAGRVTLDHPAPVMAAAILSALNGAKAPPYDDYDNRITALAGLIGRGLNAP